MNNLLLQVNQSPLAYWKNRRFSQAGLDKVCKLIDDNRLALLCIFDSVHGVRFISSEKVGRTGAGHTSTIIRTMQNMLKIWDGPPLVGQILFWLEDGMWNYNSDYSFDTPIIAFCRSCSDYQTFLHPDAAFFNSEGYVHELKRNAAFDAQTPWEDKQAIAFWRGAGSGGLMSTDRWMETARIKLALQSLKLNDPEKLDAYISRVIQFPDRERTERVFRLGVVRDYTPFEKFLKYKYQIDVDGECCAWISCFQKLCSTCLLLKVHSEYQQWYYPLLTPWKHFVPIKADSSNLPEIIDYLRDNDEEAKKIAQKSTSIMQSLSYQQSLKDLAELLFEIFSLQATV